VPELGGQALACGLAGGGRGHLFGALCGWGGPAGCVGEKGAVERGGGSGGAGRWMGGEEVLDALLAVGGSWVNWELPLPCARVGCSGVQIFGGQCLAQNQ